MTTVATVGEIAAQIRGVSYNKGDASTERRPGTVGVARAGNIADGEFRDTDLVFVPAANVLDRQLLREGDVLVATSSGSIDVVGKAARIRSDQAVAFGAFCKVLRPNGRVDPAYFAHFFQTSRYRSRVARVAAGANINNLKNSDLADIEVPLPPMEEQRRIAAVLDAADALRAKRREAIVKLSLLTEAHFMSSFAPAAASEVELAEVAEVQGGLQVTSKRQTLPLEVPYLRVANVYRGSLDLAEVKALRVTEAELQRTRLRTDDLLVVEGHGNREEIGRVGRWNGSIEPCVHQNHLIRVRCDFSRAHPRFVEMYLNSKVGRRALLRAANTTSGLNTISSSDVRGLRLPLPTMHEQQRFAVAAELVEAKRELAGRSAANLDTLFASLQQRAFAGEL